MTQIFSPEGLAIPVTVVQAGPCTVTQIKTQATDGYNAIQLGYLPTAEKHLTRAQRGHLTKAGVTELLRHLREFRVDQPEAYQLGQKITVEMFSPGQLVDVAGEGKGSSSGRKEPLAREAISLQKCDGLGRQWADPGLCRSLSEIVAGGIRSGPGLIFGAESTASG